MSGRRRSKPRPQRTPQQPRLAAFPRPAARAPGQPAQSARPYVTSRMSFIAEPVFAPAGARPPAPPVPAGSPGLYELTFVLAVPGRAVVQDTVDFARLVQGGDSLLEVPPGTSELHITLRGDAGGEQLAVAHVNASRRLRDIELASQADNFTQAASRGHDLVSQVLSRWAFLHDVAITTSAVQIVEAATRTCLWRLLIIGAVKGFSDTLGVSNPEHQALLSAYREGISSTEPLWQVLSLFRVAEGVLQLRSARRAAAIAAGQVPAEPSERVPAAVNSLGPPNDLGLADSLRPHAGRKFAAVLDDLRPLLRNAIAHLDPDGSPLSQDRWDDVDKAEQALPALRWIARQLLDAELQGTPVSA
jgi:hypothetical protein